MSGADFDYRFGTKAQWRRTAWNRIVERLIVHPRDAVVLYLAGEQDLDREVALRKGFRANNLIAVERDSRVVSVLRANGVLTISGNIVEIVRAWPRERKVNVIFADLCDDIRSTNGPLLGGLINAAFAGAVIAVNFMRGRSKQAGDLVKLNTATFGEEMKHRGFAFSALYAEILRRWCGFNDDDIKAAAPLINPHMLSYKSSAGMLFDSVVFTNIATDDGTDSEKGNVLRRKIAATLAHQTMREKQ
jgi:hypothetical protein